MRVIPIQTTTVYVKVHRCTCVHIHVEARGHLVCHSSGAIHLSFETDSLTGLEFTNSLGWLSKKPQGILLSLQC